MSDSRAVIQILKASTSLCPDGAMPRSMVYQLEAAQRFPRRIKIGVRAVGWMT